MVMLQRLSACTFEPVCTSHTSATSTQALQSHERFTERICVSQAQTLVGKTYMVKTFGCQMNLHDSERVRGLLDDCGCVQVATYREADIVVFMTCSVREKADTHLYGQVANLVVLPDPPSGKRVVAIGGCIAQRDGAKLKKRIPNIDVVFGTSALACVPELLCEAFESKSDEVFVDTIEKNRGFSTDLPTHREQSFHAWVPIMTGCNNFCTFCIVPYVRGREKSRVLERVVLEAQKLVDEGCLLYTSPSPRDRTRSRMPSSA